MKTTSFKKLTALLVAVVMVFSMCVTGVSVSAATDSSTTTVYLKPNANWTQTNARFAAYLWNDNGNTWVDATDTDGDGYYEVAVPSGYNKVIFTRMNPATKENNWDTKWNQTSDLSIPTDGKNLYTIAEGAWDEGNGEWSTYNQSTSTSQVETTAAPATTVAPATETTSAPSNTTYLQVNKNWAEGNARFAAYLWNDNGNTWVDATKTSDNVYAVTVPDGYTNVIFTRMNPATTENNWSDVWNQTADLKIELGKVYVMAEGAWDKGNGEWKNFDQPETTAPATEPATEAPATTVAPATEATTTAPANTTYLQVNKNWAESNARFAAYLWNDNGNTWVSATKSADGVYAVAVPDGYTNVIFTRMNPATTENNWSDVWNQTADLKVELGKVYVMAEGAWDKGNGEWKNFDQPTTTAPATEATTVAPTTEAPTEAPATTVAPTTEAPTTAPANTTYLQVNANWAEANARFAAFLWNDNGNTWVSATKYADNVYAVVVPDGYTNIIFTRMNPATTENNWSDVWNQTADLKVELGKVYVMAEGAWDKGEGEWKNFDQPATEATTAVATTQTSAPGMNYYLAGYINGADYGIESDAANLGDYQFENGKLTVTFTEDSYVLVKNSNNTLYQTKGFVKEGTSTTLYNASTLGASADKFMVPAGTVTFTLVDNGDDTFTLSYSNGSDTTTVAPATTVAPTTEVPTTEAPTTAPANTTYLQVNKNWAESNARFAAYLWNDNGNTWVSATKYADNVYAVVVPDGYTNIIFTRMNPATTENNWSDVWNQTADLKVELGKVYVMAEGAWDKGNGEWKNFDQPATTAPATEPATEATTAPATEAPTTAPATEAPTTAPANTTYLKVNKNWAEANARFAAYLWNDNGNTWVSATKYADNVYAVVVPDGYTNIIFTRMNPATTENNWSDVWNQTADLKVELGKVYVMAEGAWDKGEGEWKNLDQPATTAPATEPTTVAPATTAPVTTAPVTEPTTVSPSTEPTTVPVSGVSVFGDINLDLVKGNDDVYSASTSLESGTYSFKINNNGETYCNGATFTDKTKNVAYSTKWKLATKLVANGGTYTFKYNVSTNKLSIEYQAPSLAQIFGDINLDLQATKDANIYSASVELEAGSYNFRVMNQGVQYCCGYTFVDKTKGAQYNSNWKKESTLKATGGTYTFSYDIDANKLTVAYVPAGAECGMVGDLTAAFEKTSTENVYSTTMEVKAGTYQIKMSNFGKICGGGLNVTDSTKGITLNPKFSKYATFKATGGTYKFTYDVSKNVLSIAKIK